MMVNFSTRKRYQQKKYQNKYVIVKILLCELAMKREEENEM